MSSRLEVAPLRAGDLFRGLPGVALFRGSTSSVFDPLMRSLGYAAGNLSTDTGTPAGIGNVAARAVLDFRHRDGRISSRRAGRHSRRPVLGLHGLSGGERPDGPPRRV